MIGRVHLCYINVLSRQEFVQKMQEENSFVAQVMEKPKLMFLGREDDIGKPGQDQQAQAT